MAHSVRPVRSASLPAEMPSYLAKCNSENTARPKEIRELQAQYWRDSSPLLESSLSQRAIEQVAELISSVQDEEEDEIDRLIDEKFNDLNRHSLEGSKKAQAEVSASMKADLSSFRALQPCRVEIRTDRNATYLATVLVTIYFVGMLYSIAYS